MPYGDTPDGRGFGEVSFTGSSKDDEDEEDNISSELSDGLCHVSRVII